MKSNRIYLLALLSILAAFIPAILLRDFNPLNELNYLGIATESLHRGSFFALYQDGSPYADKPPLYLWICMLAVSIAGQHAMPLVLLASVIPFIFVISILDRYLAVDFRHQERLLIMLGMCSLLFVDVMAAIARMDMLFSAVMLLAYMKLVRRYTLIKESGPKAVRPKYGNLSIPLLLFLGVFIKGPYGLLFPLISLVVLMAFNRDLKRFFVVFRPYYFIIMMLLTGLWVMLVYMDGGSEYVYNLFIGQSISRVTSFPLHVEPFYFFLKNFLILTMPVGLCFVYFMLRQAIRREAIDLNTQACLFFTLTVVAIISIPVSKLEIYLLPAIPAAYYYVMLSYRQMQLNARLRYEIEARIQAEQTAIAEVRAANTARAMALTALRTSVVEGVAQAEISGQSAPSSSLPAAFGSSARKGSYGSAASGAAADHKGQVQDRSRNKSKFSDEAAKNSYEPPVHAEKEVVASPDALAGLRDSKGKLVASNEEPDNSDDRKKPDWKKVADAREAERKAAFLSGKFDEPEVGDDRPSGGASSLASRLSAVLASDHYAAEVERYGQDNARALKEEDLKSQESSNNSAASEADESDLQTQTTAAAAADSASAAADAAAAIDAETAAESDSEQSRVSDEQDSSASAEAADSEDHAETAQDKDADDAGSEAHAETAQDKAADAADSEDLAEAAQDKLGAESADSEDKDEAAQDKADDDQSEAEKSDKDEADKSAAAEKNADIAESEASVCDDKDGDSEAVCNKDNASAEAAPGTDNAADKTDSAESECAGQGSSRKQDADSSKDAEAAVRADQYGLAADADSVAQGSSDPDAAGVTDPADDDFASKGDSAAEDSGDSAVVADAADGDMGAADKAEHDSLAVDGADGAAADKAQGYDAARDNAGSGDHAGSGDIVGADAEQDDQARIRAEQDAAFESAASAAVEAALAVQSPAQSGDAVRDSDVPDLEVRVLSPDSGRLTQSAVATLPGASQGPVVSASSDNAFEIRGPARRITAANEPEPEFKILQPGRSIESSNAVTDEGILDEIRVRRRVEAIMAEKLERRPHNSGHRGVEIIGSGYFLAGISTVSERIRLPLLLTLSMIVPAVAGMALFAAYFIMYDKVPQLQHPVIGVAFGVLCFASLISLFFLLSRLFIFAVAALGAGTLGFIFCTGMAMTHLNPFLGVGEFANIISKAIDKGGSSTVCAYRWKPGLDMNFYDSRINVNQDRHDLEKCLTKGDSIMLSPKGIKEFPELAEQMKARGALALGDSLILPAATGEHTLNLNGTSSDIDPLPHSLEIDSEPTQENEGADDNTAPEQLVIRKEQQD